MTPKQRKQPESGRMKGEREFKIAQAAWDELHPGVPFKELAETADPDDLRASVEAVTRQLNGANNLRAVRYLAGQESPKPLAELLDRSAERIRQIETSPRMDRGLRRDKRLKIAKQLGVSSPRVWDEAYEEPAPLSEQAEALLIAADTNRLVADLAGRMASIESRLGRLERRFEAAAETLALVSEQDETADVTAAQPGQ